MRYCSYAASEGKEKDASAILNPDLAIVLELLEFAGIENISKMACDHVATLLIGC
jgi:hypothetical protein